MKKTLVFLVIIALLGWLGYSYIYKGHRDVESETADYILDSNQLITESINAGGIPDKYINKVVEVSGTVTEVTLKEITLNDKLFFQFENNISEDIKNNSNLTIKARCIGFDDLLEEIKLDQSNIQ